MALAETELFFGEQSPLLHAEEVGGPRYEVRPQQYDMARAVARCFDLGGQLCVEAPTGVGKTFAYLVPAYFHALKHGKPVVVSTNTINLQEQITRRDVPLLARLLKAPIACRVAKGRGNYLCRRQLAMIGHPGGPAIFLEGDKLARLMDWARETQSGDRSELPGGMDSRVWNEVAASRRNCVGRLCSFFADCHLRRARQKLAEAHLVVSNHAYLFCALAAAHDAASSGGELLPAYSALVFDEAHTAPHIAAEQLGVHADTMDLRILLNHVTRDFIPGGACARKMDGREIVSRANSTRAALEDFLPVVSARMAETVLPPGGSEGTPGNAPASSAAAAHALLRCTQPLTEAEHLRISVDGLRRSLDDAAELLREESPLDAQGARATSGELGVFADALSVFQSIGLEEDETTAVFGEAGVSPAATQKAPETAYWLDGSAGSRAASGMASDVKFNAVPIDIAPLLSRLLFEPPQTQGGADAETEADGGAATAAEPPKPVPVVITSATLAVNGRLDYFKARMGCPHAEGLVLSTPFDYRRQVTLYQPPMPDPNAPEYGPALAGWLRYFLEMTQGRTFVLFTSYRQMRSTAEALREFLGQGGYTLLMQGEGDPPAQMLERFRTTPKAVLFGADSFWTGVDVPGEALSSVIITKLPFQQLNHPLVQARDERCKAAGLSPFSCFSLPEAVLKFRQGFGRLIRRKDDAGIVVLMDSRLAKARYGRVFLNSLPVCNPGVIPGA